MLKPGAESSTNFFPSPKCQGISTNYVFLEASVRIQARPMREFRQTFAHAILEFCMPPANDDGHGQGSIMSDDFCFCLADMAHLCTASTASIWVRLVVRLV